MPSHRILFASEFTASAFLLMAVVGSGIAAERLSGGNAGLALLVNAIATGCALVPLILSFGPVSGAHMNPVVSLAAAALGLLSWRKVPYYVLAQCTGAVAGVWIAHVMFDLQIVQASAHARGGMGQWCGELVATIGLLGTILRCHAGGLPLVAGAVATYITGAYWFTSSTSFANPAVTLARTLTDTFAGIRPADAPAFVAAQMLALVVVVLAARLLRPQQAASS